MRTMRHITNVGDTFLEICLVFYHSVKQFNLMDIKKSLPPGLLCLTAFVFSYAQPGLQWQRSLGGSGQDVAWSIHPAPGSGYIAAGWSNSNDGDVSGNHGDYDFWLVRLDANGAVLWQKTLGGSMNDAATTVQPTPDGGYIVTGGTFSNDGDVSGNHGLADCWVVKLNHEAVIQWQKSLGGSGGDDGVFIRPAADGGYILAGSSDSDDGDVSGNHGGTDAWIVKLDSIGNIQWQRSLGGSGVDGARSVEQTQDGGFIVAGSTSSNDGDVSGNHGDYDFWIVKLDTAGTIEWQKTLGGGATDIAWSIQMTHDGGSIVAGFSDSGDGDVSGNHGSEDYWVVKLDDSGSIQWQRSLGGSVFEHAYSIQVASDSGYLVAGYSVSDDGDVSGNHGNGDCWVLKLDQEGALQWQKTLGGSALEIANAIQPAGDGGCIVAGFSDSNDGDVSGNHGDHDYWVVKLNPLSGVDTYPDSMDWQVFPNPAHHFIEIRIEEGAVAGSVAVTDVLGRQRIKQQSGYTNRLDVSMLPDGVYVVTVFTKSGKTAQKKIVKQ